MRRRVADVVGRSDHVVGEFQDDEALGLQLVASARVLGPLGVRRVAPPSGHLGQHGLRFEAEVDPSQRRAVPPEDPLAGGPRQSRSPDEGQEAPLEVAVAAGVRQQLVQQPDAGPPGAAKRRSWPLRKAGEVRPSRTALSMARSSSLAVADAARSMMVRDAEVQEKPAASARSIWRSWCVVWTATMCAGRVRQPSAAVNSTGPRRTRRSRAGPRPTRCETSAAEPEVEHARRQLLLPRRRRPGDPQHPPPSRRSVPSGRDGQTWSRVSPQAKACAMVAHPCWRAAMARSCRSGSHRREVVPEPGESGNPSR